MCRVLENCLRRAALRPKEDNVHLISEISLFEVILILGGDTIVAFFYSLSLVTSVFHPVCVSVCAPLIDGCAIISRGL